MRPTDYGPTCSVSTGSPSTNSAEWTDRDHLLAAIADNTGFLAWCQTKEAQHADAKWHGRIPRPGERGKRTDTVAMDVDELAEILSRPRGMTEEDRDGD